MSEKYPWWVFRRAVEMADRYYGHLALTSNPTGWWAMYWSVMNAHGLFRYPQ